MTIETKRLLLVPVARQDIDNIYAHFTKQVARFMFPAAAKSRDEMAAAVQRFMEQRANGTDHVYTIRRRADGEFLGLAGLHNLRDDIPELGIWTKPAAHGHHYGREAIGGLIGEARGRGLRTLRYPVDRRNIPSRKIPLFYGGRRTVDFPEVQTTDGRILEEEIYEIPL